MQIPFIYVLLLLCIQFCVLSIYPGFFEFVPALPAIGGAVVSHIGDVTSHIVSIGYIGYNIGRSAYCRFTECCSEEGIPVNFDGLEEALKKHVYGQHIVEDIVVNALRSHWDGKYKPQKALTLSFHGLQGSGKNYVSKFIIDNMYAAGDKSNFVHQFTARIHFPLNEEVHQYQQELYQWIRGNVTKCAKQLFIFDEVDKMPSQVLNIIKPLIDFRDNVDGVDYRHSVFIFLSNTGAKLINDHFFELWKRDGKKREDLKLKDFEFLILKGAFNEKGGFHHSDTIKSNLIDHYVPFLPMERRHVKLCILDQFKLRNITNPGEEYINEVMEFVEYDPSYERVFSKTGCKRIDQKVGAVVSKYKLNKN